MPVTRVPVESLQTGIPCPLGRGADVGLCQSGVVLSDNTLRASHSAKMPRVASTTLPRLIPVGPVGAAGLPLFRAALFALVFACAAFGATFTVSKDGRGQFTTIQAAINAAGKNDIVRILDAAVYEEQVTIDSSKAGLLLTSAHPLSANKPIIRHQDRVHVGPRNCQEAKQDVMINFDQNGALRIMRTRNVTIDGIAIDGGGVWAYGYNGVWDGDQPCQWPLQHGNHAVTVWISGDIIIRNSTVTNAYVGINVKDRNEGGIFANANPADLEPWNVVPLSGFAQTGNHIFEYNRIHDNSFGMFFESTWDLGSTVRRNLFYNNFHSGTMAAQVKGLTSEGNNQPGGALWFKDHLLSPLAIYNNTFYNNYLLIVGHWRAGAQHLIFNNIYGRPSTYWSDHPEFQNPWTKMDHVYVYRMKNSVYAAQTQAPSSRVVEVQEYDQGIQAMVKDTVLTWEVRIMNDMGDVEQTSVECTLQLSTGPVIRTAQNVRVPGNRILGQTDNAFPEEAAIRWLETPFKSTNPSSPDFLVPDWDNPLVQQFIVDQGWEASGVRDPDGSIADLGAIPQSGGRNTASIFVKPLSPVIIGPTSATMTFDIATGAHDITDLRIKYIRFIKNVEFYPNVMGGNIDPIPATDILAVTGTGTAVAPGSNSLTVPVPARAPAERYAFFELIIEGSGPDGELLTSNVGFMPYRAMDYGFKVEVLDISRTTALTEVTVGDTVMLRVSAVRTADGSAFQNPIHPVDVNLNSGADLLDVQHLPFRFPEGITISATRPAVFTRVPEGGSEYVMVSGLWATADQNLAFYGVSDAIRINPGPPAAVEFQDPPSNRLGGTTPPVIDPGIAYEAQVQVFDRYGNRINQSVQLALSSSDPLKADIVGPKTITTTASGRGTFQVMVMPQGAENDVFTLTASHTPEMRDFADMKIGRPLDQFWIFYGDEGDYNPLAELRGQVGERLKATIWASTDGVTPLTGRTNTLQLSSVGAPGLTFYATLAATQPVTSLALVDGKADVWLTSLEPVTNGGMEVFDNTDATIVSGTWASRQKLFFVRARTIIDSAFYYADNGRGAVDRVELFYRRELPAKPDSIVLYWPGRATPARVIPGSSPAMVLGPDNRHVSITLADPFPAAVTVGTGAAGSSSASSWDRPNPDVAAERTDFTVADRVGPLITEAWAQEKFAPGPEHFTITFTERINETTVTAAPFELLKPGSLSPIPLSVVPNSVARVGVGAIMTLQVSDLGANTPAPGDSIRIAPGSLLADAQGNRAHPDNAWAPVFVRVQPAPPLRGWFVDSNGDGIVESVMLLFPKGVDKSIMSTRIVWDGDTAQFDGRRMEHRTPDSTVIAIATGGSFGTSPRTGGHMRLSLVYLDGASDTTFTLTVADSAAPVIAQAHYEPGAIHDEHSRDPDILSVTFSESIDPVAAEATEPFQLFNSRMGEYTVRGTVLSQSGATLVFAVDTLTGPLDYPGMSDSIRIAPEAEIADNGGFNVQNNPDNRLAPLSVEPRPYAIVVKAGPNPFNPLETANDIRDNGREVKRGVRGIVLAVDPLSNLGDPDDPDATRLSFDLTIYDSQGAVVARSPGKGEETIDVIPSPWSSKTYIVWSGRNDAGRYVGAGSYLARLLVKDDSGRQSASRSIIAVIR